MFTVWLTILFFPLSEKSIAFQAIVVTLLAPPGPSENTPSRFPSISVNESPPAVKFSNNVGKGSAISNNAGGFIVN